MKVGRPPKHNKPPTTTVSITKDRWQWIRKNKWKGMSMDQFCDKVFSEYEDLKLDRQLSELRIETATKVIEEKTQVIEELKSLANVKTIEELKSKLRKNREATIIVAN